MISNFKSFFRPRNFFALMVIFAAGISVPYVISTSQEWALGSEKSLLSVGTGIVGDWGSEGEVFLRKAWILTWFSLCALILICTPLIARARGKEFGIWFLLTGIWMLLPTPLASNVHKFWWSTFQWFTATKASGIDLLGCLASVLIIALPLWALIIFSVKLRPQEEPSQG